MEKLDYVQKSYIKFLLYQRKEFLISDHHNEDLPEIKDIDKILELIKRGKNE